jgi:predicted RNase H-like HicB family nuclease
MKSTHLIVIIEQDEDGIFIGSIPNIPSCHAQGDTQEEMLKNLSEVAKLCLRNASQKEMNKTRFVGIQNLVLSHA